MYQEKQRPLSPTQNTPPRRLWYSTASAILGLACIPFYVVLVGSALGGTESDFYRTLVIYIILGASAAVCGVSGLYAIYQQRALKGKFASGIGTILGSLTAIFWTYVFIANIINAQ